MAKDKDLLIAEVNYEQEGKLVQIGQFHYVDRALTPDMILARQATKPTPDQEKWFRRQGKGTYNRRDMNAREP
jgi:hypothetical protein